MTHLPQTDIDHTDIMQVIALETQTFAGGDFAAWAACWVQDDRTRQLCISSTTGATVLEGWPAIAQYMREVFDSGSGCNIVDFQRENVLINMIGNVAWVVFDGRSAQADGQVERTYETRVLEKAQGRWRIVYSSFLVRGHQREDAHRLAVDADGMVLHAPPAALASLKAHPSLQISNGRLRAAKPDWDKLLQAGFACAAEQHRYFQQYRYSAQSGQTFRLPIVLGETDTGGVAFCTLFVRDEMTFVETQSDGDLANRLAMAKAIYGLSDGQLALAACIVSGDNLSAAADNLGISINTVRTHLSRIYDKTGVNAQTALVRILLSVG
ncbi:nuclear transport factor 2 family protein [Roseobacter sp. CCS2]|uniref:nuclear transport factor 2 family protein n=1 Tax=Roseobacter sp. CCS2 TaxID=391593 RepID=UPI0000F3E2AE|nr:nuclear transport factor 2 family protein [Roseobacter sp. CCS2]EBA12578.1 LuxR-type transcription regulator required for testosterone degradation [Roseobacter sp. CCS2]